jgi:two-component system sensor histidine kinase KdpD
MARLQSGRVQLDRQWQPIDEVVGSSLRLLADVLAGRPVAVDLPADLPLVRIDAVLIERVLCNLLENAVKHSVPGAGIRLAACVTGEALQVAVCNEGGGFPLDDPTALFDPFVRGEGTLAPGTGIGLAVCRTIVLAHGGHITAENHPGGACVRFGLPLGTPPEMEGEPA